MKGRDQKCRDEVIAQNLLAANVQAEGAAALDDPDVMYVLETAVGTSDHRIYELSLGRVIARLAEELSVMEAQIEELKTRRSVPAVSASIAPSILEEEPVLAGRSRR